MTKIKRPAKEAGKHVKAHEAKEESPETQPPLFSLRYLSGDYCLSQCERDEKAAFADALHTFSKMTWAQIKQAGRHGLGQEKIARSAIQTGIPRHISEDVHFIALRFQGKKPMVGYRVGAVFYVLWIDRNFTLYSH